ncbi:hypothetical protein LOAG_09452 [Loa loa]|uniref:Uncharacterized protein n=1 Tax=Loa loa TaxID=7209 RepID=A0A1I7V6Y5_LOALO|nr:hypothetical protein LOAG_09452 [Loa loa]EFO19045.1 hypothetical protein LOAG_09452 [Loa loa]
MSKEQSEESSSREIDEASSSSEPFFDVGPEIGGTLQASSSSEPLVEFGFDVGGTSQASASSEPAFEAESQSGSVDQELVSTTPGPSTISSSSASGESSDPSGSTRGKARPILENLTIPELWAQYVKCLMMAAPSNAGRVEIERSAGLHAEKYLEQIIKLSPAPSTTTGEPLSVPCFNPDEPREVSEDERYKVEILKATKADSELIWNTAAQSQALVLIRRGRGPAVGLDELRKFNTAMQEAADIYREAISTSQERSVSRVGNYYYRVSYAGKTETYHADMMRGLILDQLPLSVRFFTEQTKSERLKSVLYELKQKRKRKQ